MVITALELEVLGELALKVSGPHFQLAAHFPAQQDGPGRSLHGNKGPRGGDGCRTLRCIKAGGRALALGVGGARVVSLHQPRHHLHLASPLFEIVFPTLPGGLSLDSEQQQSCDGLGNGLGDGLPLPGRVRPPETLVDTESRGA